MSIEQRLRDGLAANTDVLLPQVDHELGSVLRRAHRRWRVRVVAAGLAAAVVVAGGGWLARVATEDRSDPEPSDGHGRLSEVTDMRGFEGALEPGTYSIPQWGDEVSRTRALVDVPTGYFSPGGWAIDPGSDTSDDPADREQYGTLAFFRADTIVTDPCAGAPAKNIGDTPQALAEALSSMPGLRTTMPEPVTIDGHPGLHLKLRVAKDVDLSTCAGAQLSLWKYDDNVYDLARTDTVNHLWILQVDDERIITTVTLFPDQPPGQNAEMIAMANGVRFTDPPS